MNRRTFFGSLCRAVVAAGVAIGAQRLTGEPSRLPRRMTSEELERATAAEREWIARVRSGPGVYYSEYENTSGKTIEPGTLVHWDSNGGVTT